MKKLIALLGFAAIAGITFAQDSEVICHTTATEKFAAFASNSNFNAEHPTPAPYVHQSQEGGKMVTFKTQDGQQGSAYFKIEQFQEFNLRIHACNLKVPLKPFIVSRKFGEN